MAPPPARAVVLRFGALGDVVLTLPALETLAKAWPDTEILFATKAVWAPLVENHPQLAGVLSLCPGEGAFAFRRRVARAKPDVVLDLHDKIRSRVVRSAASRRVVWEKRSMWQELSVRLRLRRYKAEMRIAERYHAAVEKLVGRTLEPGRMRLGVQPAQQERAGEILKSAGVDVSRPLVGMAPAAMWPTKQWPAERFAQLARRLLEGGVGVVLTGSEIEKSVTAPLAEGAPGIVDLGGRLELSELLGVIDACTAFVANDSGPMHLARALGVPTLALFGSTDPAQFDFSGHALMFANVDCAPCSLYGLRRCPKSHFDCMLNLSVERTFESLEPLLDGKRRAPVLG